jgi:formylglycine-generating enzyme required for sulfatase activity
VSLQDSAHEHRPTNRDASYIHDAFISYRRSEGTYLAQWLRARLQSFKLPVRVTQYLAERDESVAPLAVAWDQSVARGSTDFYEHVILPQLSQSRFLIVIATPGVRARLPDGTKNWVEREVDDSLLLPQAKNIIVVSQCAVDTPIPEAIYHRFPRVHIVDLCDVGRWNWIFWRRRWRVQEHLAEVVGPLYGLPPEWMPILREEQRIRQRHDLTRIAVAAVILALLMTGLAMLAWYQSIRASENEALATEKANNVLSLSAIQDLKDLEARAELLWPATPEMIPNYDAWLRDARQLIDGRSADPGNRIKSKPSRTKHELTLTRLRERSKPLTKEQVEVDRHSSPVYSEWVGLAAKLTSMRRVVGSEPWPTDAEVEADLASESLPSDPRGLSQAAMTMLGADGTPIVYGREKHALSVARRAMAAANSGERAAIRQTLQYALVRCGYVDEALAEQQKAVDEAEGMLRVERSALLSRMQDNLARWNGAEARAARSADVAQLTSQVAKVEVAVNTRRTYDFEESEDGWWHAQLSKLVADMRAFTDEESGGLFTSGISTESGWAIEKRAAFARTIEQLSVDGPDATKLWADAIASIEASPKYGGLKLVSQLGLLPIGFDLHSGLCEFAHLQTGEPAVRGKDGRLKVMDTTGLVFVLIPGGTFWMGAQSFDPNGRNHDPQAEVHEGPVHKVNMSPYFISKYEMTQGQWSRITGRNPSGYGPTTKSAAHTFDLTHPVENVTWTEGNLWMKRLGLTFPSEAQWEFACRGETLTPWWTGDTRESLRGKVNLADQTAATWGAEWEGILDWPDLVDGWVVHAPVSALSENKYGLSGIIDNVYEWCEDTFHLNYVGAPTDGRSWVSGTSEDRVFRGGAFVSNAGRARSAARNGQQPTSGGDPAGLRPARSIVFH